MVTISNARIRIVVTTATGSLGGWEATKDFDY